ncbi:superinfection immunity protein [Pseudomonas sp. FP1762]|uniref:superinfection immunity protein n=1 Tax=Pseudomonas sp. FP1762 TaxID=2954080 RepID=UPI0027349B9C|nr:superinfection immunity protein [Pseudomonas sp. FP1762]WLG64855.1 superinfection immunity protein [Pseudomonas sp. FP1762]
MVEIGLGIVFIFLMIATYFLPSFNAFSRKHPDRWPIFMLDLFLGWTLIGWVVSLVWSVSSITSPGKPRVQFHAEDDKYQKLEKIGSLKEKGLLTESEFEAEKAKLLQS